MFPVLNSKTRNVSGANFRGDIRYLGQSEGAITRISRVVMDRHVERIFGYFSAEGVSGKIKNDWALAFSHDMEEIVDADANNRLVSFLILEARQTKVLLLN